MVEDIKLIAEFMGLVYIPWNDLQGFSKPGWWCKLPDKLPDDEKARNLVLAARQGRLNRKLDKNYRKGRNVSDLSYRTWNWLMKVVEKIEATDCSRFSYSWKQGEKIYYNFQCPEVEINGNSCDIYFDQILDPILCISENTSTDKLDATFKACVEFIKWYNNELSSN